MSDSLRACSGIVMGQVQGVGFRYFTRRTAASLNLSGWVMNRSDGSVQFHVEGPGRQVEVFLGRIEKGPRFGLVERLLVEASEPAHVQDFQIRYE